MNRQQKEAIVSEFQEMFSKAHAAFLVKYKGVNVAEIQRLRMSLRQDDAVLKVTKARLMKLATNDLENFDGFRENIKDQVGLVFALGQVPVVAKEVIEFSKESDFFKVVLGLFEKKVITKKEITFLASLPSREVLLGQVVGTLQAPIAGLARVLNLVVTRLLHTLQQASEK